MKLPAKFKPDQHPSGWQTFPFGISKVGKGPRGFALCGAHSSAPGEIGQIIEGLQFRGISPQNKTGGFCRV
jgi:hypothetical protein